MYKIGDLVVFKEYCYYGVLAFKPGLVVGIGETPRTPEKVFKVLVEEQIYEVHEEEFEFIS